MHSSLVHKRYWSLRLYELLREMASQNTNAVLMLFKGVRQIQKQCHYPPHGLIFGDGNWRAYYHSHDEIKMHENEHGHFHLFTSAGKESWSHVVGLSVDRDGGVLQWFTVNRWVTGGPWLKPEGFIRRLEFIATAGQPGHPVSGWLCAMIQLYRDEIHELLTERDQQMRHYAKTRGLEQAFEDRNIYRLTASNIDMQRTLENSLLNNAVMHTSRSISHQQSIG